MAWLKSSVPAKAEFGDGDRDACGWYFWVGGMLRLRARGEEEWQNLPKPTTATPVTRSIAMADCKGRSKAYEVRYVADKYEVPMIKPLLPVSWSWR